MAPTFMSEQPSSSYVRARALKRKRPSSVHFVIRVRRSRLEPKPLKLKPYFFESRVNSERRRPSLLRQCVKQRHRAIVDF